MSGEVDLALLVSVVDLFEESPTGDARREQVDTGIPFFDRELFGTRVRGLDDARHSTPVSSRIDDARAHRRAPVSITRSAPLSRFEFLPSASRVSPRSSGVSP